MDNKAPFNSSDYLDDGDDWDQSQFARKSNAASKVLARMLETQAEDRVLSKKNLWILTYSIGAPETQAMTVSR